MKNGNYVIGSIQAGGAVSFSNNPKVHTSITATKTEVARLAKAHPGKRFAYFKLMGSAVSSDIVWS